MKVYLEYHDERSNKFWEADKDTALASVPDEHFESAAETVAAREDD